MNIYSFLSKNKFLLPVGIFGLTALTLYLTLMPSNFLGESPIWSYDKLGHLALFGSWTYILGLYHHFYHQTQTNLWVIFFVGVAFGLLIELLQYSLPVNRHADWGDFIFDTLGCLIAIGILQITLSKK